MRRRSTTCARTSRSHGGDVELLGVEDGVARLRLQGSCNGCPSSAATLRLAIEDAVLQAAPDLERVEAEASPSRRAAGRPARQFELAGGVNGGPRGRRPARCRSSRAASRSCATSAASRCCSCASTARPTPTGRVPGLRGRSRARLEGAELRARLRARFDVRAPGAASTRRACARPGAAARERVRPLRVALAELAAGRSRSGRGRHRTARRPQPRGALRALRRAGRPEHRHLLDLGSGGCCARAARARSSSTARRRAAATTGSSRTAGCVSRLRPRRRGVGASCASRSRWRSSSQHDGRAGAWRSTRARWARRSRCSSSRRGPSSRRRTRCCASSSPTSRRCSSTAPRGAREHWLVPDRRLLRARRADPHPLAGAHRRRGGVAGDRARSSTAWRQQARTTDSDARGGEA